MYNDNVTMTPGELVAIFDSNTARGLWTDATVTECRIEQWLALKLAADAAQADCLTLSCTDCGAEHVAYDDEVSELVGADCSGSRHARCWGTLERSPAGGWVALGGN